MNLEELAAKLKNVKWNGQDKFTASCPSHDDAKASLAIRQLADRKVLHCFAGCTFDTIVSALGLSQSDFFNGHTNGHHKNGVVTAAPLQVVEKTKNPQFVGPTTTTRYQIKDVDGAVFAVHCREDGQDATGQRSKRMWWETPDGQSGLGGLKAVNLPLFGTEMLRNEDAETTIVVVEGEKAARSLQRRGIAALGTACGASATPSEHVLQCLKPFRDVVLWPDNDDIGRKHMSRLAQTLQGMGVRWRTMAWADAPAKGDAADFEGNQDEILSLLGTPSQVVANMPPAELPQLPDIFAGELQIMTGRQLLERHAASKNQCVIEGFLSLKEISIWSGKVEAGKTTLLRTAAMCVARGEPFLERTTIKGRVLYVMLDADGIDLTTQEFLRLGYDPDRDPIDWLIDPILAMRQDGFSKFYGALLRLQPTLVIIDPFGRFQEIKDFNAYDATYAMARISELAKQANCHIALPHHIPRGRNDDADAGTAGLGSISIGGGTNARFVCTHKPGDIYTIKTSKGKGASFVPLGEEYTLNRHPDTGWITLGAPYSWKAQAVALKPQVLQVVERSEEPMTASQISKELGLFKSACGLAANMLWEDGEIDRDGTGKRGKKYQYSAKKREAKEGSQYEFNS